MSTRSSAKRKAKRNGRGGANVHPSDWMAAAAEEIQLAVDFLGQEPRVDQRLLRPKASQPMGSAHYTGPRVCVCACK